MKRKFILFNLFAIILSGLSITAAADFCSKNCNDCCEWSLLDGKVTLGADWLYWKVQQDGINTGFILNTDDTSTPLVQNRDNVRPNFKYDNGFRVNLGYELPCDCWDVNVIYTYMPSQAKTTPFASDSEDTVFFPVLDVSSFANYTSKWDFNGNNIDLDFGRTVCFGECLKIRPHAGFRATWFDQKFRSLGTSLPSEGTVFFSTISLKETFQGYGAEAGLWADFKLGYGVSLVGHFGGAILYSRYEVKSLQETGITVEEESTITFDLFRKDKIFIGTPMVDYFVGLQYADCFCDMLVRARVGWEQHVLFDTNRYLSTGNLSTQGLTLGLEVGF